MSQYLDTGIPPPECTSYLQISNTVNETQMSDFLSGQSTLIAFDNDLILALRKIQTVQNHLIITAIITSPNGSPFKFHARYQKIFKQFFNSSQYIKYGLIHIQDYFTIQLLINFNSFDASVYTKLNYHQEISSVFKKYKKWLLFMGKLRKRNRLCLQMDKKSLQLKTNVILSLINKLKEQNQQTKKLQTLDNNNNIYQLNKIKQVLKPNEKIINLKNKNSRISINKKLFQITHVNGIVQTVHLAQKTVKNPHDVNSFVYFNKVVSELNFVKLIKFKKYLLNYYAIPEEKGRFYMEYIEKCLKEVIYKQHIGLGQILIFSKQLIEAVDLLHLSNVTHRDLKMENILVKNSNGERMLKIIDYGQSSFIDAKYDGDHSLGATLPYSPIQCMLELEEGYNNPAIDLWSILVIIYQMIYKQLPVFFSYELRMEIAQGWRSQGNFALMLDMRPKRGLAKIEEYICILTEEGLKIEQKQRLKLRTLSQIIEQIINFQNQMNQTLQKFI